MNPAVISFLRHLQDLERERGNPLTAGKLDNIINIADMETVQELAEDVFEVYTEHVTILQNAVQTYKDLALEIEKERRRLSNKSL